MEPSFFAQHRPELPGLQVSAGDALPAYQDLAFRTELDFAAGQRFADGTASEPKGMIHADERGSLGEPVALDDGVSQTPPEFLGGVVEGGTAGDERPKFPSQPAMDPAKTPPAPPKFLRSRGIELAMEFRPASGSFFIALDFFFQRLQHPRHRHQHRDPFGADGLH